MKTNDNKKMPSLKARIMAAALAALMLFGSVAGVLMFIFS